MMPFRVAISTAPNPQGSGRVDILKHPYTTAVCAAGVVTGTADRDSSRYRYNGNRRTRQLALDCACNRVKSTHVTTCMKIRESVVSLSSLILPQPPEDIKIKKSNKLLYCMQPVLDRSTRCPPRRSRPGYTAIPTPRPWKKRTTQHTAHSTQHTAHSTQHTAHSTQHTAHSTQQNAAPRIQN